jgi:hypothetical protein
VGTVCGRGVLVSVVKASASVGVGTRLIQARAE